MSLSDQLVAYYKLDEASGNAVNAASGSYTLTNYGTTTYTTGKINNGADFGASNTTKYLLRPFFGDFILNDGAMSISCWVKLNTEVASSYYCFAFASGQSTFLVLRYEYNSGTRRLRLTRGRNNLSYVYVDKTVTLGTSNWYHIVGTYDGSNMTLYVDGVKETPVAASGNGTANWHPGGGFFSIGCEPDANGGTVGIYASAIIDEVAFYQRAITDTEVLSLYNNGFANQYPFANTFSLTCESGAFTVALLNARVFWTNLTNAIKYSSQAGVYYLAIGGGYRLLIGGLYKLLISPLGITNESKVSSTITNNSKPSSSMTNESK